MRRIREEQGIRREKKKIKKTEKKPQCEFFSLQMCTRLKNMHKYFNFVRRNFSVQVLKSETENGVQHIPGPKGIFGIGNFYNYTKTFGKYSFDELHKAGFDNYKKYGSIVCERMLPGVSIVWLYDPIDIAQMFNDGPGNYPCRRSHLALEKFRNDRPEIYKTGGLLPTNGPEWWKIRSEFQKGFSSPQSVRQALPSTDEIVREFIEMIPGQFNSDCVIKNMVAEFERLNLELVCRVAFDERLNSFSEAGRDKNSLSTRLIESAHETNTLSLPLDQGFQLWRLFETKEYKKLRKAQESMQNDAIDLIKRCIQRADDGNALLHQYLKNPKVSKRDIVGMICDFLLGGVHTSSYSTGAALYHISKNKHVQDLMHEEAMRVLPKVSDEVTPQIMNSEIPYTRAVLKETFRLNPISIGIGRILNHDTIFSGYLVPKNTTVVSQNFVACRLEENFKNALQFQPERWMKTLNQQKCNPYLVIPFGHGMRSCIARRFAEQSILIFLLRLMRSYSIEWKGEQEVMDIKTKLINQPSCDINIKFKKRFDSDF